MDLLLSWLTGMSARAEALVPTLAVAFLIGEWVSRYSGVDALLKSTARAARFLSRKLDRSKRGIATRLYRGIVALLMFAVPALVIGVLLARPIPWLHVLLGVLLVALFGRAFATVSLWRAWRQARRGTMLELPGIDFLFPDQHAVLRYLILTSGEQFAIGVVGASFWYVLGGVPLLFFYLSIAILVAEVRTPVFGWAAAALFRLLDAMPRLLTLILLTLAACVVGRPFAVVRARSFHGVLARLLHIALGGAVPGRNLAWEGDGPARIGPEHLGRALQLRVAASVLLLLLLSYQMVYKLLILFI